MEFMASDNQNAFDYDTGFLCTYHLMMDDVDANDPEDGNMSENLYRIQLSQALRMKIDISRIIAGDRDGYDHHTMKRFSDFISDKTKPYYDDRYKAVLRKHPCLNVTRDDERNYDSSSFSNDNEHELKVAKDTQEFNNETEPADDIDTLINDVVPMLMAYDSFHAFHRCMIDVFSVPNAMGLISDESLRLLESTYGQISESMRCAPSAFGEKV